MLCCESNPVESGAALLKPSERGISMATFVSENLTENGSSTINGITMGVASEVEGVITSITLASGQVIAYRI